MLSLKISMLKQLKYQIGCSLITVLVLSGFTPKLKAIETSPYFTNSLLLAEKPENNVTQNVSALEIFRKAYKNRYTWNDQFPGYTAAVEFKQGKDKYNGNISVSPDLSVEVTGINDEEASQTIKNQLLMLAVHRHRTPFEVAHKDKVFKFGTATKAEIVEIIEDGGKAKARYQLVNNQVIEVNRLLGPHAVVVKTLDTETTPEGYIATQYQSTFHDAKTNRLIGEEISSDTYKKVGNYYLPTRQVIQHTEGGNTFAAEFNFTQIKLMQPKIN